MKKKNQLFVVLPTALFLFISVIFITPGCKYFQTEKEVISQEELSPISFRLKWLIYSSFASHFVALDKNYFVDEGLKVNIEPGGPGVDPIRLVATGTDDVGLAGYEQIIMAREKGIPVIAIGEDYIRSGVGFFSLKSKDILDAQDFIGKKVGILPGTDKYTLYMALMNKLGIDRTQVNEIPVGNNLSLLFNEVVDVFPGFVTNQPFIAEERGMPVNIVDPYDFGVRPGGNVYFTSEETLKNKRSELKSFLKAVIKGIIESQKLSDEAVIDIMLKYNDQLDKNVELKIWKSTKEILLEKDPAKVGFLYQEKWEYTAEISKEYGLIKSIPDIDKCYTNELIEEIHNEGLK